MTSDDGLHGKTVTVKVNVDTGSGEGGNLNLTAAQVKGITEQVQAALRQQANRSKARHAPGWTPEAIDRERVTEAPDLERTVVAVVPGIPGHRTGIVAAGRSADDHFYILGDYSLAGAPSETCERAVAAYRDHEADVIIGEVNITGDYLGMLLRSIDSEVAYGTVHAMRELAARISPVAELYEQGRVHHAGTFVSLEGRMSAWTTQTRGTESQVNALALAIIEVRRSSLDWLKGSP